MIVAFFTIWAGRKTSGAFSAWGVIMDGRDGKCCESLHDGVVLKSALGACYHCSRFRLPAHSSRLSFEPRQAVVIVPLGQKPVIVYRREQDGLNLRYHYQKEPEFVHICRLDGPVPIGLLGQVALRDADVR